MSANIENVISPYQIVEVKGDKVKGLAPSRAQLSQVTGTLKNHEVSKVEHIHRDYNLNIPMLNDHFTVLDFTYDILLTTYLGQVLNSSAKVPKNFKFNRIIVSQNPKENLELYAISEDRHEVMKVTLTTKANHFIKVMDHLNKEMRNIQR